MAEALGLRAAVALAAVGGFGAPVILWFSAVRRLRVVPVAVTGVPDEATAGIPRTE